MVVNHSIERMLAAFEQANRLADLLPGSLALMGTGFRGDFLPTKLLGELLAVERIISATDPLKQWGHSKGNLGVWGSPVSDPDFVEPDR
jgi:hypothetical protein